MKRLHVLALILLFSCSSKNQDEKLNVQSIVIHNSMIKKANKIKHQLNLLRSDTSTNSDSVEILLQLMEEWEKDLVEVPGNENHHHESHHHDHRAPDVTAEQMLAIQRESDARLSNIGKRTANLNTNIVSAEKH